MIGELLPDLWAIQSAFINDFFSAERGISPSSPRKMVVKITSMPVDPAAKAGTYPDIDRLGCVRKSQASGYRCTNNAHAAKNGTAIHDIAPLELFESHRMNV
jgi:hypothetical protein